MQRIHLAIEFEERERAAAGLLQAPPAEIIRAAFDQYGRELIGINRLKQRDIFLDQLLLEIDGVRRDDDAFFLPHGKIDRRQEIGERFADAGARFDQQMLPVFQCFADGACHLELLRTKFVSLGKPSRDGAFRRENVL